MKEIAKKYKKQEGITLVALVITIVVMLILAGVSISILTADEGLIIKISSAVEKYNNAVNIQDEKIGSLINEIITYYNNTNSSDETISPSKPEISTDFTIDFVNDNINYTVVEGTVGIDENYGLYPITYVGEASKGSFQYATIYIDYDSPILIPTNFEISSYVRYADVSGMGGWEIRFQKKLEDETYEDVFTLRGNDAWTANYMSFYFNYYSSVIVSKECVSGQKSSYRRYSIVGNETQFVGYVGNGNWGTLARTDLSQISFDRIEIKLFKRYGYGATPAYITDIYIGEPKYITQ